MKYSDKPSNWPVYTVGALFVIATVFLTVSKPRENSSFHYDMSGKSRSGLVQERNDSFSDAEDAPAAAAGSRAAQEEAPPAGSPAGGLPEEQFPAGDVDFSGQTPAASEPGAAAASPRNGGGDDSVDAGSGAAGAGSGSGASGSGSPGSGSSGYYSSDSKSLAAGPAAGRNQPSSPGGRADAASAKKAGAGAAGKAGSLSAMRPGVIPNTADLFKLTDKQIQGLGKAAQQQIQKIRNAIAAEEKPYEEIMAAANSTPYQPPSASAPPVTRGKVWPVKGGGHVSQEFGPTSWAIYSGFTYKGTYYPHFHTGIDIAAPMGTPMLALDAGKVVYAGGTQSSGVGVVVQHPDNLATTYHHMGLGSAGPTVRVGDYVNAGQVLGYIGMTGMTTGPHCHFIARKGTPINPREVLPSR